MGPPQSPPLSIDPPLAHITHLDYLPGREGPGIAPQSGVRGSGYSYLVALLTLGCLWPTPKVTGPCPGAGCTAMGIITSMQARHDRTRRARTYFRATLNPKPRAEGRSCPQRSPSPCREGASPIYGVFSSLLRYGNKIQNSASCIKGCVHMHEGERGGKV